MKLLNKILKRFGYTIIDKDTFDIIMFDRRYIINIWNCQEIEYCIDENMIGHYFVGMYHKYNGKETYVKIKEFTTDNKYYNRHCAKMLLDELEKEIKI